MSALRYAIVSPVRDEARFLPATMRSLAEQTVPPARWIIVDDGSEDGTGELADAYAAEHDWIEVVHRPRRTTRARGAPIIEAFDHGLERLAGEEYDVVVKLDGDLRLPAHYFEWVLAVFERVETAGLVGGVLYVNDGGRWVPDKVGRYTVHGAVKAYRRAAFEAMGGLRRSMGWDGIDEYALRARGWTVHPLSELFVLHYKMRGSAQPWLRSRWEEGRGAHYIGYGAHGIAIRVAYRVLKEVPPVLGGLVLGAGYAWAKLTRQPDCGDPVAIAYLRAEQRDRFHRLLRGRGDIEPVSLPEGGPAFWSLTAESREADAVA